MSQRLAGVTICITNKVPLRAETLAQLPDLKLIAVAATGTDIVDKQAAKARGITVVNIRNYAFNTVPEHVFAMIFALRRNLIAYREDVKRGVWQTVDTFCFFPHPIHDLRGAARHRRVQRARQGAGPHRRAFDMTVLATDLVPAPGLLELDAVLQGSDMSAALPADAADPHDRCGPASADAARRHLNASRAAWSTRPP